MKYQIYDNHNTNKIYNGNRIVLYCFYAPHPQIAKTQYQTIDATGLTKETSTFSCVTHLNVCS